MPVKYNGSYSVLSGRCSNSLQQVVSFPYLFYQNHVAHAPTEKVTHSTLRCTAEVHALSMAKNFFRVGPLQTGPGQLKH